jgi:hypothetical protein
MLNKENLATLIKSNNLGIIFLDLHFTLFKFSSINLVLNGIIKSAPGDRLLWSTCRGQEHGGRPGHHVQPSAVCGEAQGHAGHR